MQGRLALFLALLAFSFVRSDARLSLRSLIGGGAPGGPGPLWPIRLVQIVLTVLYGVNALAKSTPAYLHGDVILGQSLMLPNYRVDLSGGVLGVGPLAIPLWATATAFHRVFACAGILVPAIARARRVAGDRVPRSPHARDPDRVPGSGERVSVQRFFAAVRSLRSRAAAGPGPLSSLKGFESVTGSPPWSGSRSGTREICRSGPPGSPPTTRSTRSCVTWYSRIQGAVRCRLSRSR